MNSDKGRFLLGGHQANLLSAIYPRLSCNFVEQDDQILDDVTVVATDTNSGLIHESIPHNPVLSSE